MNLAYRWFCKLGIEDSIPDPPVFCRARHERFREMPERKGGPCVSTVSIVCGPTGHLQGWARARSTAVVANGICRTSGLLF